MSILKLIGREKALFTDDLKTYEQELNETIANSSFLIIGGAGSIGQAVSKEIFKRNPQKLYVVDISENNLVELVRDIRSSLGYIKGEFKTFALDVGSKIYDAFLNNSEPFDYVLNLSALKHVRSEEDAYTLMRMVDVNILNTQKTLHQAIANDAKKFFCVSTDKATNPVNMMGASKRVMEMFLMKEANKINISTARFANVAFSDGSLLHGFNQRIQKQQPIVAPNDIKRYFITQQEAGQLCMLSCLLGNTKDIFFPKQNDSLKLTSFSEIAARYLENIGYTPYLCNNEDEARELAATLPSKKMWPCLFTKSNTTGEKVYEEFFTKNETIDVDRFSNIGVIINGSEYNYSGLEHFKSKINELKLSNDWNKSDLVKLFKGLLPNFKHKETGKYLDGKM